MRHFCMFVFAAVLLFSVFFLILTTKKEKEGQLIRLWSGGARWRVFWLLQPVKVDLFLRILVPFSLRSFARALISSCFCLHFLWSGYCSVFVLSPPLVFDAGHSCYFAWV